MTPTLRPTERLSLRSKEEVLTLTPQTVLFQEKGTSHSHTNPPEKNDRTVVNVRDGMT